MAIFDLALILPLAGLLLLVRSFRIGPAVSPGGAWALLGIALALLVVHALFGDPRWQLAPLYLGYILLGVLTPPSSEGASWLRSLPAWFGRLVFIAGVALTVTADRLAPVFQLPEPTGSHAVGTFVTVIEPTNGRERPTPIQVWYPAIAADGVEPMRLRPRREAWRIAREFSRYAAIFGPTPSFIQSHFGAVRTHSFETLAPAVVDTARPVVLYSHSVVVGEMRSHVSLMEDLASNGFVAVSVGHIPDSAFYYADITHTVHQAHSEDIKHVAGESFSGETYQLMAQASQAASADEAIALYAQGARLRPNMSAMAARWGEDMKTAYDYLLTSASTAGGASLAPLLDAEAGAVAVGWSLGGGASAHFCISVAACRGWINYDGSEYEMSVIDEGTDKAGVYFAQSAGAKNSPLVLSGRSPNLYGLYFKDLKHLDFSDAVLWGPLWQKVAAPFFGAKNPKQSLGAINALTLRFAECAPNMGAFLKAAEESEEVVTILEPPNAGVAAGQSPDGSCAFEVK